MWGPLGDTAGPGGGPPRELQTSHQNPVTETVHLLLHSPPAMPDGWGGQPAGSETRGRLLDAVLAAETCIKCVSAVSGISAQVHFEQGSTQFKTLHSTFT